MQTKFLLFIFLFVWSSAKAQQIFKGFDLNPNGDSYPRDFTNFNGKMYFTAYDAINGLELWVSDGTDSGSHLLKDINPGVNGSGHAAYAGPENYMVLGNLLLFAANDGSSGYEPWITDGTSSGTLLLKDINPVGEPSSPQFLTHYKSKIYFTANDGSNGSELWVTDGTSAGTVMVKDINLDIQGSSSPSNFYVFNGFLYFIAYTTTSGYELWVSDGTAAGTQMVKNINPNSGIGSDPALLTSANGKLFFVANDGTNGKELWVSDGTTAGTSLVKDINTTTGANSSPEYLTAYNGKLYFSANNNSNGTELWVSDGESSGTLMVKDIVTGQTGSYPTYLKVFDGRLFFNGYDAVNGEELWSSDGTTAGTTLFKDITAGVNGSESRELTEYKNKLYFIYSYQLYCTDGTAAGTKTIAPPIAPNTQPFIYVTRLHEYNNSLYFMANYNTNGAELWSLKDTTGASGVNSIDFNSNLVIYPNPSDGVFHVDCSESFENGTIEVTDMFGKLVVQHKAEGALNTIDLSNLTNGLYLVRLMDNDQIIAARIVILQR